MKNKITHIAWLDDGCIGVVRVESEYDPPTYYIKAIAIQSILDCFIRNENTDAISVAHRGYKISNLAGAAIIDEYGKPFEIEYS